MLSEQERRDMKEMAASTAVREEFRQLKAASRLPLSQPVDLDQLLDFLTTMSRLAPEPARPTRLTPYRRLLL